MAQAIIRGGLVLDDSGSFVARDLVIEGDRFADTPPTDTPPTDTPPTDTPPIDSATIIDARGTWVIPGVYDAHEHITWNDFHLDDRRRRSAEEAAALTAAALTATLRGGILNIRDGGGADAALRDALAQAELPGPRLQVAVDMIGPDVAGTPDGVRAAVDQALARGAQWIKLVATAGVASPPGAVLASNFSEREMKLAAELAERGGARLMVHTWGGDSLDWAIEYGAGSIEHGIYLDAAQAERAAAAGVFFVPTLRIYREVRGMVLAGTLGGVPRQRITDVVARHDEAVRIARDAGVRIALGSDFSTPEQHGTNLVELAALRRAGLSSAEALLAATSTGAALFADPDGGSLAAGKRADAVLLAVDPAKEDAFERPDIVRAVVKDGALVTA